MAFVLLNPLLAVLLGLCIWTVRTRKSIFKSPCSSPTWLKSSKKKKKKSSMWRIGQVIQLLWNKNAHPRNRKAWSHGASMEACFLPSYFALQCQRTVPVLVLATHRALIQSLLLRAATANTAHKKILKRMWNSESAGVVKRHGFILSV